MIKVIIFALCVAASLAKDLAETKFDENWKRECPKDHQISRVRSHHSSKHDDRAFTFTCKASHAELKDSHWSHDWTKYNTNINFECPSNGVITGLESKHEKGDRIFKFRCNILEHGNLEACKWTPWANAFDGKMDFTLPAKKVLSGLQSEHSKEHKDRRFKVRLCNYK